MIIAYNIFLISPMLFYLLLHRKNIFLFSPLLLPFLLFTIYYIAPSTAYALINQEYTIAFHHMLYGIGILSFLCGLILKKIIITRSEKNENSQISMSLFSYRKLLLVWCIGCMILFCYGLLTGIIINLFRGQSIEDLRRTAEIGKGYIKEPGYFLCLFSSLLFVAQKIKKSRGIKIWLNSGTLLVFLTSLITFLNTGHKAPTLLAILLWLGIINLYKHFKLKQIFVFFIIGIMLIGTLNVLRNKEGSILNKALTVFYIYNFNYVPIVNKVYNGEIEKVYGKEYYVGIVSLIPRFIWSEKPLSFDYKLKDLLNRNFEGGGLPPTIVGSFYLNFGLLGVILCMFIVGYLYQWAFICYKSTRTELTPFFLFFLFILNNPSQFFSKLNFMLLFGSIIYTYSLRWHIKYKYIKENMIPIKHRSYRAIFVK